MRGRAYVEIDRSRSDAWAILSRPRHTLGEAGFRPPAASSAAVNHPLMLDDHEAGFRQIKHLPLLNAHNHRRRQSGKAMATCLRLAPLNDVRLGGRLQRAPACTRLSSARLARLAAQGAGNARRFFQPVARRRLAAVRAVRLQPAPKLRYLLAQRRVLRAQNLNLALKRRNQIANLGAEKHSYVDSYFPIAVPRNPLLTTIFSNTVPPRTQPAWQLQKIACSLLLAPTCAARRTSIRRSEKTIAQILIF